MLNQRGSAAGQEGIARREFVKSSGGLLIAAALSSGCAEVVGTGSGTIRVTVAGLTSGTASAGSVTISGPNLATALASLVPAVGTFEKVLPVGRVTVGYTPTAGDALIAGVPSTVEVDILADVVTDAVFAVERARGEVRVTVAGLASGSTTAGSLSLRRTDIVSTTEVLALPGSGQLRVPLNAGTYSMTFSAPTGYSITQGAGAATVILAGGATAELSYEIIVAAPTPSVIFHSDWSTATGTSDAAVMDTGKAKPWGFRGAGLEVVLASGLGFPSNMQNVLKVGWDNRLFNFVKVWGLGTPAVGTSRYYRWYFRYDLPNDIGSNKETHPIQDGGTGVIVNWVWNVINEIDYWWFSLWPALNLTPYPYGRWFAKNLRLPKGQVFRFELMVRRVAVNGMTMSVRVYNSAGVQIGGDADVFAEDSNSVNLANVAANLKTWVFYDVNNLGGLNAGCNNTGAAGEIGIYGYQGGFAVSDSDWIGPYANGV